MTYFYMTQLHVHEPSWAADYRTAVAKLVEEAGGKYIAAARELDHLEGDSKVPSVTVIIEFPSKEAALSFYENPAYKPWHEKRLAGATGDVWLLPGL